MFTDAEYTSLVEEYIDSIFRIALNYTKEPADAEDITQEVFFKLYRENRYFESREHCKHWLIRVAINACKKWARSPWRRHVSLDSNIASMPREPEQKDLVRTVLALPKKYSMPIYLHYFEGYSTQEIAELLGIPKGTVCTNLDRGRRMLRLQLEEVEEHA